MLVELDLVVDQVGIFRIVITVYEVIAAASRDICVSLGDNIFRALVPELAYVLPL